METLGPPPACVTYLIGEAAFGGDGLDSTSFAAAREARDHQLELPTLPSPALQVNIHANRLPRPESNGPAYLKIPLNRFQVPQVAVPRTLRLPGSTRDGFARQSCRAESTCRTSSEAIE